jgi:hypothetical protein
VKKFDLVIVNFLVNTQWGFLGVLRRGFERGTEDCAGVTQGHDEAGEAEEDVPAITP